MLKLTKKRHGKHNIVVQVEVSRSISEIHIDMGLKEIPFYQICLVAGVTCTINIVYKHKKILLRILIFL